MAPTQPTFLLLAELLCFENDWLVSHCSISRNSNVKKLHFSRSSYSVLSGSEYSVIPGY